MKQLCCQPTNVPVGEALARKQTLWGSMENGAGRGAAGGRSVRRCSGTGTKDLELESGKEPPHTDPVGGTMGRKSTSAG